ncbi:hypothetical protein [Streptomyces sp. NPDC004788]
MARPSGASAPITAIEVFPYELELLDFVPFRGKYRQIVDLRRSGPSARFLAFHDGTKGVARRRCIAYRRTSSRPTEGSNVAP